MVRIRGGGPTGLLLIVLAVLHGLCAWQLRELRPSLVILDPPPSQLVRSAMALGDDQFLYRNWVLDLQNAGDTGGRATPMRDYNYANVMAWLETLESLDPRAQAHLYLAAHYFSQTPRQEDIRRLVDFIAAAAERMPALKWPWLVEAATIAEVHLHDLPYAISLSHRVMALDIEGLPLAVRLTPGVLMLKAGRTAEARREIEAVAAERGASLTQEESAWLNDLLRRLP
jgi:hypothetical protein